MLLNTVPAQFTCMCSSDTKESIKENSRFITDILTNEDTMSMVSLFSGVLKESSLNIMKRFVV